MSNEPVLLVWHALVLFGVPAIVLAAVSILSAFESRR